MTSYYVKGDTGNDTTGNGSSGTPWKTIKKFIQSYQSGDVCNVYGGLTYSNDYSTGRGLYFHNAYSGGKTCTIQAWPETGTPTLSYTAGDYDVLIEVHSNITSSWGKAIIIGFTIEASNNYTVVNNGNFALRFENCTFTGSQPHNLITYGESPGNSNNMAAHYATRTLELINCTFGPIYDFLHLDNAGLVTLLGSSFMTPITRHFSVIGRNFGGFDIRDITVPMTINGDPVSHTGAIVTIVEATGTVDYFVWDQVVVLNSQFTNCVLGFVSWANCKFVRFEGNTITLNSTASHPLGLMIGKNDTTDWLDNHLYVVNDVVKVSGFSFQCRLSYGTGQEGLHKPHGSSDWETYWERVGVGSYLIRNNRIINVGGGLGHCLLIGTNILGAVVEGNYCEGGDRQLVDKGSYTKVLNNVLFNNQAGGQTGLYACGCQYCFHAYNTVVTTTGDGYGWSANQNVADGAQDPVGNVCIKNIFDVSDGGTVCIGVGVENDDYDIYVDENCYYPGSLGVGRIVNTSYDHLSDWRIAWLGFSSRFPLNDSNSIEANPSFLGKPGKDLRVQLNSPCLNRVRVTPVATFDRMGAYAPRAVVGPRLGKSVYTFQGVSGK